MDLMMEMETWDDEMFALRKIEELGFPTEPEDE